MPLMNWSDNFSVNVREIDTQHKRFFTLLNEMHDAMLARQGKDVLGKILQELVAYTETHFTYEESLFKKYNYPATIAHTATHAAFVKQVAEFQQKFQRGDVAISIEVMTMLKNWLTEHIRGVDQQYAPFFRDKGVV